MRKTFRFFVAFLFALLCVGVYLLAEEITLTTYYPAPYGNYEELQATKLAVGSETTMPTQDGYLTASGAIEAATVQANTAFNFNGNDGVSDTTYTVVTDVRLIAGPILQKKTRSITVKGGIITNIGSESNWQ